MATTSSPPAARTASKPKRNWLSEISTDVGNRPTAAVVYGPPGIGKTSIGAATPNPVFLIDDQEDGVSTLKASKLIAADLPVLPAVQTWEEVLEALTALDAEHGYKTLVIDTLGGLERLCHEFVCRTEFKGVWGEKGFSGYARGYEVSLPHWREMLNKLDRLRQHRGIRILALAHSIVRPFKNPEGDDYDRYIADMHHKTWAVTHKWADMILFANYYVEIDDSGARTKGKGGQSRFFNTEYHAAYDAKNRHGLPPAIEMGASGTEAWTNLITAMTEARNKNA